MSGEIVSWIISSSLLILLVLVLRRLFDRKISRRMRYALWLVVLVRLLIPFSFGTSRFSIQNWIVPEESVPVLVMQDAKSSFMPNIRVEVSNENIISGNAAGHTSAVDWYAEETQSGRKWDWAQAALWVWRIGTAAAMLWIILVNVVFYRKLKKTRAFSGKCGKMPVYVTDAVKSPCLFGVLHPSVYLTSSVAAEEKWREYALLHESCHMRQGDHIWAVLRGVCAAVWWWNPLVWMAAKKSRYDSELACDEACVNCLGEEKRIEYGTVLIDTLTANSEGRQTYEYQGAATLLSGKEELKFRLRALTRKPMLKIWAAVLLAVILLVGIVIAFTGNKRDSDEPGKGTVTDSISEIYGEDSETAESLNTGNQTADDQTAENQTAENQTAENQTAVDEKDEWDYTQEILIDRIFWEKGTVSSYGNETAATFSEQCRFFVNSAIDRNQYEEVDRDVFSGLVNDTQGNKYVLLQYKDGQIGSAYLESIADGLRYFDGRLVSKDGCYYFGGTFWLPDDELTDFTLEAQYEAELSDKEGTEKVKVYTGKDPDYGEQQAILTVESADGNVLFMGGTDLFSIAGDSYYLGEVDGAGYLVRLYREDRWDIGDFYYNVLRFDSEGNACQLSGSIYEWELDDEYGEGNFTQENFLRWAESVESYLQNADGILKREGDRFVFSWTEKIDWEKEAEEIASRE